MSQAAGAPATAQEMSGYDPSALAELHNAWGIEGLAYPWSVSSHESAPAHLRAMVDLPDGSLVALLDAAVNLGRLVDASSPGLKVPSSAEAVVFRSGFSGAQGAVDVRARGRDGDDLLVDIAITAADGTPCVDIHAMRYTAVEPGAIAAADADPRRVAHALDWQPWTTGAADEGSPPSDAASIAVLGDGDVAGTVRERLLAAGHHSADAADARYVVYVADPAGADTDLDISVRLTTEVSDLVGRLAGRERPKPGHAVDRHPRRSRGGLGRGRAPEQPVGRCRRDRRRTAATVGRRGRFPASDDPDDVADAATAFAAVLSTPIKSVAVLRGGQFLTSQLAEITTGPVRETLRCRPDAAYLITGGMGALGLLMANWLADRGARRVILAGRTPLPPRRQWDDHRALPTLPTQPPGARSPRSARSRCAGVSVETVALDIGSGDAVRAVLDKRDADGTPPIRGVIHAAGVTEAQLLTEIDEKRVLRTLWPKVAGARALDDVFPPGSLDFLYLAASAGAVFGIPGQGAYAAANAYLDGLARARHRQGCNTVSLDWVAWHGLGFGAEAQLVISELERVGSRPVLASEAFAAWDFVTRLDIDQVVMAPMQSAEDAAAVTAEPHRPSAPTRDWSAMAPDDLRAELQDGLRTILATELRLPESDVHTDRPFAEMGLNSVMAMSIRREIEQLVGLELSATMLFNHPTIATFATYLARQLVPDLDGDGDVDEDADDSSDSLLDSLFDSVESN